MRNKIDKDFYFDTSKIVAWYATEYGIEYLVGERWHFIDRQYGWDKALEKVLREIDESDRKAADNPLRRGWDTPTGEG